jgi:methylated-DNA-[protein]-cysteine S-methyltransferase
LKRFPGATETPPWPAVEQAIAAIQALLRGEAADLSRVELDQRALPDLERRVYEIARAIPPGSTLTYGQVAARLGLPGTPQQVGQALARNPFPLVVPCHRVLAADGKPGGFSAPGGVATKLRLLALEGATAPVPLPLFDAEPASADSHII